MMTMMMTVMMMMMIIIVSSNIMSNCNNTNGHFVLDSVDWFSQPLFHSPSSWGGWKAKRFPTFLQLGLRNSTRFCHLDAFTPDLESRREVEASLPSLLAVSISKRGPGKLAFLCG